jgi:FtsZ-interacting cell division protein YlmF
MQAHRIDEQAQRLADFFNGEVITQDGKVLE